MQLNKVTLYVENQEDAIDFWVNKVGLEIILKQPMGPGMNWVEVGNNAVSIVLYERDVMRKQNPEQNVDVNPGLMFTTTDVVAEIEELSAKGVKFDELLDMPYGKMVIFYDQDGNKFVVREN